MNKRHGNSLKKDIVNVQSPVYRWLLFYAYGLCGKSEEKNLLLDCGTANIPLLNGKT